MPSRKSDSSARRSDVSAARFVLAEDTTMDSTTEPARPSTAAAKSQSETTPAREQSQQANQSFSQSAAGGTASPSEKKDHSKDKDKEKERDVVTIEDLNLPKSIITRLAKGVLPANTQIQANAILALSKSATVFISHIASTANEFTVSSNKKTIMPADVFKALDEAEFGFMRERLEAEFAKFNEVQTSKRSTYRKKVAAAKKAATGPGGADDSNNNLGRGESSMMSVDDDQGGQMEAGASFHQKHNASADGGGQPRAAKKAKTDAGAARVRADGGHDEVSDAETVPDDAGDEDEDEEEEEDAEDEEEEEEEDAEDEEGEEEDDQDEADEDEAVDDGEESE